MFKRIKIRYNKWIIKKGLRMLMVLEDYMVRAGIPRNQRRAVWRAVASKSESRNKVIQNIADRVGITL